MDDFGTRGKSPAQPGSSLDSNTAGTGEASRWVSFGPPHVLADGASIDFFRPHPVHRTNHPISTLIAIAFTGYHHPSPPLPNKFRNIANNGNKFQLRCRRGSNHNHVQQTPSFDQLLQTVAHEVGEPVKGEDWRFLEGLVYAIGP
jgi:hypothetical protein